MTHVAQNPNCGRLENFCFVLIRKMIDSDVNIITTSEGGRSIQFKTTNAEPAEVLIQYSPLLDGSGQYKYSIYSTTKVLIYGYTIQTKIYDANYNLVKTGNYQCEQVAPVARHCIGLIVTSQTFGLKKDWNPANAAAESESLYISYKFNIDEDSVKHPMKIIYFSREETKKIVSQISLTLRGDTLSEGPSSVYKKIKTTCNANIPYGYKNFFQSDALPSVYNVITPPKPKTDALPSVYNVITPPKPKTEPDAALKRDQEQIYIIDEERIGASNLLYSTFKRRDVLTAENTQYLIDMVLGSAEDYAVVVVIVKDQSNGTRRLSSRVMRLIQVCDNMIQMQSQNFLENNENDVPTREDVESYI